MQPPLHSLSAGLSSAILCVSVNISRIILARIRLRAQAFLIVPRAHLSFALPYNCQWGVYMDRVGRRPVMMQSLAGLAVFTVGYGMATSLEAAMVFRFICGGFNGVAITAKTVLAEAVPQRLQVDFSRPSCFLELCDLF